MAVYDIVIGILEKEIKDNGILTASEGVIVLS
jgi:hypothetical protein